MQDGERQLRNVPLRVIEVLLLYLYRTQTQLPHVKAIHQESNSHHDNQRKLIITQ